MEELEGGWHSADEKGLSLELESGVSIFSCLELLCHPSNMNLARFFRVASSYITVTRRHGISRHSRPHCSKISEHQSHMPRPSTHRETQSRKVEWREAVD